MKGRYFLFLLSIVFFIASQSFDICLAEGQRHFHSEENGYSITIPDGWLKVPDDVVQKSFAAVFTEEFKRYHKVEAVFAINFNNEGFLEYPYLIVQVIRYSKWGINRPLKKNEIEHVVKIFTGLDVDVTKENVEKRLSKDVQGMISEIEINKVLIDKHNMVYKFRIGVNIASIGRTKGLAIGHIGRYGIVQLMFYSTENNWSRFEKDRNLMLDSFQFEPGMRYEDAHGKWLGIFENLGESVAKGLAYACLALFIGLIAGVAGLIKRLFCPEKKQAEEENLSDSGTPTIKEQ